MNSILVGTSGYNYKHWKGIFYPPGLKESEWLGYYSKFFNVVELNVTFYRLPQASTFKKWREKTPDQFFFVLKGPRLISHYKKLKDIDASLDLFFNNAQHLKEKLVCVLWQFPKNFKFDGGRFQSFAKKLKKYKKTKFAFEFRNLSWFCEEAYEIVRLIGGTVVAADWPFFISEENNSQKSIVIPTFDFLYLRRHGSKILYSSSYTKQELQADAKKLNRWSKTGKPAFIFFNNDALGYAVKNALEIKKMLK